MGTIIGRQGLKIKQIQDASGVRMVAQKEMLPQSTERIVEVQGTPDGVQKAVWEIGKCLVDDEQRGYGTVPYSPAVRVQGGAPPINGNAYPPAPRNFNRTGNGADFTGGGSSYPPRRSGPQDAGPPPVVEEGEDIQTQNISIPADLSRSASLCCTLSPLSTSSWPCLTVEMPTKAMACTCGLPPPFRLRLLSFTHNDLSRISCFDDIHTFNNAQQLRRLHKLQYCHPAGISISILHQPAIQPQAHLPHHLISKRFRVQITHGPPKEISHPFEAFGNGSHHAPRLISLSTGKKGL